MRPILFLAAVAACTPEPESTPLQGPGFDDTTGALLGDQEQYMVALTFLEVRNAPGPGGRFGDHANAIGNYLFEEEPAGWVGTGFRNVGILEWWTMSVWESEEAMLDFVVSEPHVSAMADLTDVSRGAVSTHLWMDAEDLPLQWSDSLEILAAEQRFTYGNPSWP